MSNERILVTGATGQQGGSVVRALLEKGHSVYGLTRNPDSERARETAAAGVTLLKGDFQDPAGLKSAFEKVNSVFVVSTPFESGTDAETQQGIAAVEAAKETGVGHLVYSSVSDADKNTGIPHFDSKYRVEQHLKASGVPFTIIAPAFFYNNMMAPFMLPGLQNGTLAQAVPADIRLQSVSVGNIGDFAALVLSNRDAFLGRRIDIAGDELTGPEYAATISAASDKEIGYFEIPADKVRETSEDMALMYEWFTSVGYSVDISALQSEFPQVQWEGFSQWANRQDWSVLS